MTGAVPAAGTVQCRDVGLTCSDRFPLKACFTYKVLTGCDVVCMKIKGIFRIRDVAELFLTGKRLQQCKNRYASFFIITPTSIPQYEFIHYLNSHLTFSQITNHNNSFNISSFSLRSTWCVPLSLHSSSLESELFYSFILHQTSLFSQSTN
ncbi:hypothetical protein J6590_038054 [Homalodisca vitripennis]|nr:hypothetical protein J6590_038054 [Homalodisca vitripennis]